MPTADYLSKEELDVVADCLRKNEQSFLAYSNSPPISNLIAAGLVSTPGGEQHMDYYPFYIRTRMGALLARKDEFIAKDDEHKRREAEEERKKLQRRRY